MGLFSKKPKPATSKAAPASLAPPSSTSGADKAAPTSASSAPASKAKKGSVDPTDFLALRHELMDLKARLEASEQAKAIVEARLAALDATTTAMATERPVSDELSARVSELQAQLEAVAETVATKSSAPVEPTVVPVASGPDPELVARIDALSAHLETVSSVGAPDPTIETRLEALTARVEAGTTQDPGLLARLDQLSARVESTPDAARLVELEERLGELAAKANQPAPVVAAVAAEPDPETIARLDALAERVAAVDAFGSQLAQLNARVTAQAEFGAQLGSLRDRITELSNDTEDRRAAAFAATGDADLRDRVNAIADRLGSTEGIAAQMALLAERVAANDSTTRQAAEQVAAVEQRLNSVSTELANQVSELGRDIDGLAAQSNGIPVSSVSDEVIETLKTSQVKLAAEQARYEIAFRQDLAALAEQVRRQS